MKPTRTELAAAAGKTLPDVIASRLDVLFCGSNPGLYAAAVQQHFGRPGNRFWPTLHKAGFTPRLMKPAEQYELLKLGMGITNVVARATAASDELTREELVEGARILEEKVKEYRPDYLAFVGIGAYRTAFHRPKAKMGLQDDERIGHTRIWVLPKNDRPAELVELFADLRKAAEAASIRRRNSLETKRAMFRAAVVAQCAGETHVKRDRIVASFLTSGGVAAELIHAIEDPQAIPFSDCLERIERQLAAKGIGFGSKEHLAGVQLRPLDPAVLTAFGAVMHRDDERVMTLLELLVEMMRNDPALTARLAQHGLNENVLGAALAEK